VRDAAVRAGVKQHRERLGTIPDVGTVDVAQINQFGHSACRHGSRSCKGAVVKRNVNRDLMVEVCDVWMTARGDVCSRLVRSKLVLNLLSLPLTRSL
jgi:hypothetical protein